MIVAHMPLEGRDRSVRSSKSSSAIQQVQGQLYDILSLRIIKIKGLDRWLRD